MRPKAPDTRGMLAMEIEQGRMQVVSLPVVVSSTGRLPLRILSKAVCKRFLCSK